jgi:hypothetical protein
MRRTPGHASRGLCIAGLLCLAAGVLCAHLVHTYGNIMYREERVRMIILAAVILSGIFFISATARWWMRH